MLHMMNFHVSWYDHMPPKFPHSIYRDYGCDINGNTSEGHGKIQGMIENGCQASCVQLMVSSFLTWRRMSYEHILFDLAFDVIVFKAINVQF